VRANTQHTRRRVGRVDMQWSGWGRLRCGPRPCFRRRGPPGSLEPGARPNRGGGGGCARALAVYKPPPPKKTQKNSRLSPQIGFSANEGRAKRAMGVLVSPRAEQGRHGDWGPSGQGSPRLDGEAGRRAVGRSCRFYSQTLASVLKSVSASGRFRTTGPAASVFQYSNRDDWHRIPFIELGAC
jgi:hypothetical protein